MLAGVAAFLFSTFLITIVGEIIPQAYLSRNAMKAASMLAPAIRFYQYLLYPLGKPTALALDAWLGKEGIQYVVEDDLIELMKFQMGKEEETNVGDLQSMGIINFMLLDKTYIADIGNTVDTTSIVLMKGYKDRVNLPEPASAEYNDLTEKIKVSSRK